MPEPKTTSETAARVAELKKLEADLAKGREAAKTQIVTLIDAHVAELRELGFSYEVVETNGTPKRKTGRPPKNVPPQP
jgi:hypothetical protein